MKMTEKSGSVKLPSVDGDIKLEQDETSERPLLG